MSERKIVKIQTVTYLGGPIDAAKDYGVRWRQRIKPQLVNLKKKIEETLNKEYPECEILVDLKIQDPVEMTEETFGKSIDEIHKDLYQIRLFNEREHARVVFENIIIPDIKMVMRLKEKGVIGFGIVYFAPDTPTSGTHCEIWEASGIHFEIMKRIFKEVPENKIPSFPLPIFGISPDGLAGFPNWIHSVSILLNPESKIFYNFTQLIEHLEPWLLDKVRQKVET
ncbi:MAG: hypothetical protein CO031_00235 [Candidatus Nealsonbacteria bacterium CG_4_9_14_0_2_um_filter_37_38]|uniref:Uncharacterized protein n=1 Tax=Candidatus Nealsonbacteria bacterium CG_4_10_14_0_8_um_filter_37_14 TaxID=1974684 RepID=A0A2M7R622_9BACT|nr:MAG: hypothetical protein COV63_01430 [Candidatus Nealsonbacteria bacterium CG11_big_fil_rev_8_21_14_0_20_37_68]PIW92246.1 MAG: hypothetical protein COZ89_00855 [Candidatus Nealsonbacteria bacterium CG_4_8_14_3_um_filter_37_23]PIY88950.1 MAG: hypothetical protein COY73_02360 [Candidatus Nealsonbacteria bacterium CG_4_10_14_0_8_um_filter_37_14]PJC51889.1 MAG: hypothetical protein CO031_00235 [Candidatus Nealsonbacteria bacterium CG_4_9_14_0_2_um_filter_37_38]